MQHDSLQLSMVIDIDYMLNIIVLILQNTFKLDIFKTYIFITLSEIINKFLIMNIRLKNSKQEPVHKSPTKTLKIIQDRYEIKNIQLGQGSYGQVFACWDSTTKTVLAAKTISKTKLIERINNSNHKDKTKRFYIKSIQDEAYLMKKLDHKNILKFYGLSESVDNVYFFVQYCNQGSLAQKIQKEGKIHYEKALLIFRQIFMGCLHLHERKICHRDIKPQNILMHNDIVKLSDFGFATFLDDADNITSQFSVGSAEYMAPQILFQSKTTLKCDVWSLGVTFYNMLYGRLPWKQFQNKVQWQKELHNAIVFPREVFVPIWITSIIEKMLTYQVQNRPTLYELTDMFKF